MIRNVKLESKKKLMENFEHVQGIDYEELIDMLYSEAKSRLKFGKTIKYTDEDGYTETAVVDGQLSYIGTNDEGLIVAVFDVFDFESGSATLVYEADRGRLKFITKKEEGIITYPRVYKKVKSAYGLTDILLK